jgi:ketosteroid isomerase-like protein
MTGTTAVGTVVAEHIAAVNAFDEDAIVATFADDALVNDAHREFWGTEASAAGSPGKWSATT